MTNLHFRCREEHGVETDILQHFAKCFACYCKCILCQAHLHGRVFITCANVSAVHHEPCHSNAVPLPSASQGGGSGPIFLGISNSSIEASAVSSSTGMLQEKAVPWLSIKMQNCLLGVLHLLREQKAGTHILEQPPGQCSFNTGHILLSFTHRLQ